MFASCSSDDEEHDGAITRGPRRPTLSGSWTFVYSIPQTWVRPRSNIGSNRSGFGYAGPWLYCGLFQPARQAGDQFRDPLRLVVIARVGGGDCAMGLPVDMRQDNAIGIKHPVPTGPLFDGF
jgi:hypothetical protein